MKPDEIARICLLECRYWGDVADEKSTQIAIGAMGAAANICTAVLREITPEQYEREIKARSR